MSKLKCREVHDTRAALTVRRMCADTTVLSTSHSSTPPHTPSLCRPATCNASCSVLRDKKRSLPSEILESIDLFNRARLCGSWSRACCGWVVNMWGGNGGGGVRRGGGDVVMVAVAVMMLVISETQDGRATKQSNNDRPQAVSAVHAISSITQFRRCLRSHRLPKHAGPITAGLATCSRFPAARPNTQHIMGYVSKNKSMCDQALSAFAVIGYSAGIYLTP